MLLVSKREIKYFIIVLYVLLMSGSFFGVAYSDVLAKINAVVTALMLFFLLIKNRVDLKRNIISLYLLVSVLIYLTRMVMWSEFYALTGYAGDILIIFTYVLLALHIDYNLFVKMFIRIMVVMSIGALIGLVFFDKLIASTTPFIDGYWSYHFFGIFALRAISDTRTIGLFWEPGMFQGYLIFAMMLLVLKEDKRTFKDLILLLLFGITTVTTRSTTGFFLLIVIVFLLLVDVINPNGQNGSIQRKILQWCLVLFSVGVALIIINSPQLFEQIIRLFPEDVVGKLLDKENISTNTRSYGMLYDVVMSLKHPLGIGRDSVEGIRNQIMQAAGITITGRTSSWTTALVYAGLPGGLLYIFIYIKGAFKASKDIIKGILAVVIMVVIVNTEPHYGTIFFNMIVIMWYMDKHNVEEMIQ